MSRYTPSGIYIPCEGCPDTARYLNSLYAMNDPGIISNTIMHGCIDQLSIYALSLEILKQNKIPVNKVKVRVNRNRKKQNQGGIEFLIKQEV